MITVTSTVGKLKNTLVQKPAPLLSSCIGIIAPIMCSEQALSAKSIDPEILIETVEVRVYQ
jgi:hypothetical protein